MSADMSKDMSKEDYLWDSSGKPEPELLHLERVLAELRWSGKQPEPSHARPPSRWWGKPNWAIAVATSALIAVAAALFIHNIHNMDKARPVTSWELLVPGRNASPVRAAQVIETGPEHVTMQSEFIGELDIDPNSRLHLLTTPQDEDRIALDHGTIHALIWAPPTRFVVDTPAAKAVDLGCQYTLSVAKDGKGFLTVQVGWVAFQWHSTESFIPQGAACATRIGHGPGTPYFLDAPNAFTESLAAFDLTGNKLALNSVLATARPRDALTLWHLLQRTQGSERREVFDRFSGLVSLPPGLSSNAILRGDRQSMDAAWDALKLGDTSWWRTWKRDW